MNHVLSKILGIEYPKVETTVFADLTATKVTLTVTFDPDHVDFDSPQYIESKWKKKIPALESIGVSRNDKTGEQLIIVSMSIDGHYNKVSDIVSLKEMARTIARIAEDRLSEPEVIKNIGNDCKPWIHEDGKQESA